MVLVAENENVNLQQTIFWKNQNILNKEEENKRLVEDKQCLSKHVGNLKYKVSLLTKSLKTIKKTPFGGINRVKSMAIISSLVSSGGAMKKRVHAIKSLMNPNKIKEIQDNENLSHILKSMFKKEDIISMIRQTSFSSLRKSLVDQVINQIAEGMSVEKVQSSCDDTGISR